MSTTYDQVQQVTAAVAEHLPAFERLQAELHQVIVGQNDLLKKLLVGLLADGHLLLEGVPGLAKTMAVQTLAAALGTRFQRIQFTPDLLPADILGTQIYQPRDGAFVVKHGPIFANLILADEINRAPAKVQSALLEAMQERQVTIGEETFPLPQPFLVLATQNPIEQEGTYPLPEAQVDRFLLKLVVDYPSRSDERLILDRMATTRHPPQVQPVLPPESILAARRLVDALYMDEKVRDYIVDLVHATRRPRDYQMAIDAWIEFGASPRATLALALAARAWAFLAGRGYVTPQDVKSVALDALRHRIVITYEAEAEDRTAADVVRYILEHLPVP